jgi:hypothetical protein
MCLETVVSNDNYFNEEINSAEFREYLLYVSSEYCLPFCCYHLKLKVNCNCKFTCGIWFLALRVERMLKMFAN